MDVVGYSELRQRTATAGNGNWTRCKSGEVQSSEGRNRLQRESIIETGHTDAKNKTRILRISMLTQDQAAEIFARIRKYATADEVECLFYGGRSALTRFANNTIHQNMAEENYGVSVRTVFGGRTARATTNKFDDDSLQNVVRASESLARVQQPDSDLLPVPSPDEASNKNPSSRQPSRHFGETAALTPAQRADAVGQIVAIAQKRKLTAAGIFASSDSVEGIFNSRGVSAWHAQTSAEVSTTMLAADSSGWQKANSPDVARLDPAHLAQIAAEKAVKSAAPREIAPGK